MLVASVLFTTMGIATRLASKHLPWSEIAAFRALVGALVAVVVAKMRGAPLTVHNRKTAWSRSACGTLAMICSFYTLGAPAIAVGDAVTLGATSPIFIALLSPRLLGEKSTRAVWIATTIAFAGVALVAGPKLHLSAPLVAVALLGAFFTGLAMIFLRRLGRGHEGAPRESPEAIVVHFSFVAGGTLLVIALPTLRMPDLEGGVFALVTAACGALAQIAQTRAYQLDRAARVGVFSYLGVVLTELSAIVVLGEHASLLGLAGMALVIVAGVHVTWSALRERHA